MADRRTAAVDRQIAAGLVYTGLFGARPNDDIAFAVGTTHVNSRVADVQTLQNSLGRGPVAVQGSEFAFELYYTFRPTTGCCSAPTSNMCTIPAAPATTTMSWCSA